jgi:hypothetical protein
MNETWYPTDHDGKASPIPCHDVRYGTALHCCGCVLLKGVPELGPCACRCHEGARIAHLGLPAHP